MYQGNQQKTFSYHQNVDNDKKRREEDIEDPVVVASHQGILYHVDFIVRTGVESPLQQRESCLQQLKDPIARVCGAVIRKHG